MCHKTGSLSLPLSAWNKTTPGEPQATACRNPNTEITFPEGSAELFSGKGIRIAEELHRLVSEVRFQVSGFGFQGRMIPILQSIEQDRD
jgi:hypothetical protein